MTTTPAARVRAKCRAIWKGMMFTEVDRVMGVSLHSADLRALIAAHDAQAAEIARLTAEMQSGSFYQEKDIDAMQAEIARLRSALRQIAGIEPWDDSEAGYVDKARAALKEGNNA